MDLYSDQGRSPPQGGSADQARVHLHHHEPAAGRRAHLPQLHQVVLLPGPTPGGVRHDRRPRAHTGAGAAAKLR